MTWQPDPDWTPLASGMGASTGGVWLTGDRRWVVKRLLAPGPSDDLALTDPTHHGYWRREAEVAMSGVVAKAPGLRSPECRRVDEDSMGLCVWQAWVPHAEREDESVAAALGRFTAAPLPEVPWLSTDVLRRRLTRLERRGGPEPLAGTGTDLFVARRCGALWRGRDALLGELDRLPHVPVHGDPVPANLRGRAGEDVVAIDWSGLGMGPVGGDLGLFMLSSLVPSDVLLDAYAASGPDRAHAHRGAVVTAAFTLLLRAVWSVGTPAQDGCGRELARHAGVLDEALA